MPYNPDAVQQQIERDRRRHKISKREERMIHALLKGNTPCPSPSTAKTSR